MEIAYGDIHRGGQKGEVGGLFCYFGDMIGAGCGAEEAVRARVSCAWAKFKELTPVLTFRGVSLKVKGKEGEDYRACICRGLRYMASIFNYAVSRANVNLI